jgi:voltage-gated potassium channel
MSTLTTGLTHAPANTQQGYVRLSAEVLHQGRVIPPEQVPLADWAARGIHTRGCKQMVWEVMSSRALKVADLPPSMRGLDASQLPPPRVYLWTWRVNRLVESLVLVLILSNVVLVVLSTTKAVKGSEEMTDAFYNFEMACTAIFTVEYVLRVASCTAHPKLAGAVTGRFRFARQPLSILDLVAVVPFYIDFVDENPHFRGGLSVRLFRLLRLVSLFRLERQLAAAQILVKVFRRTKNEMLVTFYAMAMLILVSATLAYYAENTDDSVAEICAKKDPAARAGDPDCPSITSLIESLYWSTITVTTVGYGDKVPTSPLGKALAAVISALGVLMFALPAGILGSGFVEVMQQHHLQEEGKEHEETRSQLMRIESRVERIEQQLEQVLARLPPPAPGTSLTTT